MKANPLRASRVVKGFIMSIPELERHDNGNLACNSWTIINKETGKTVMETWQRSVAEKVNTDKYQVLTTMQHLQRFNQSIAQ